MGSGFGPALVQDRLLLEKLAGNLYRLMSEEGKERLIANLAGAIAQVSREDIVERAIGNFAGAGAGFGKRLEAAVRALRGWSVVPGRPY